MLRCLERATLGVKQFARFHSLLMGVLSISAPMSLSPLCLPAAVPVRVIVVPPVPPVPVPVPVPRPVVPVPAPFVAVPRPTCRAISAPLFPMPPLATICVAFALPALNLAPPAVPDPISVMVAVPLVRRSAVSVTTLPRRRLPAVVTPRALIIPLMPPPLLALVATARRLCAAASVAAAARLARHLSLLAPAVLGAVATGITNEAQRRADAVAVRGTLEAELAAREELAAAVSARRRVGALGLLAEAPVLLPLVVHRLREVHLDAPAEAAHVLWAAARSVQRRPRDTCPACATRLTARHVPRVCYETHPFPVLRMLGGTEIRSYQDRTPNITELR